MLSKEISKRFHRTFRQLFIPNMHLNGLKSALYCFGLSASRYIEYTSALTFLSSELKASDIILEIGCGHSILPTLWAESGSQVITVDINRDALKWQINKSREMLSKSLHAVLADGKNLPFKDGPISAISCISAIEHVPGNGDIQVACEIGRVLKPDGLCIVSFSLSRYSNSYSKRDWAAEIPPLMKRVFKSFLPITNHI